MHRIFGTMVLAVLILRQLAGATEPGRIVRIRIDASQVQARIGEDFLGFGYETSAVAQDGYFTPQNTRLVRLYGNLGGHGLIRIGGNVSDHTHFDPHGIAAARTERDVTIINEKNLAELGEFARATGWQVMWGLNLGTGSRDEATDEAIAVQRALGDRLHSFEIGNEVDLLRKFSGNFDAYHAAYLDYKSAIRARLPQAAFSGPDVAGSIGYVEKFVAAESSDVKLITHHYYRTGARRPNATIEYLLASDEAFDSRLEGLNALCAPHRLPFRINEVNSFYGGGKAGVSDTFASALWCLDYLFNLAAHGAGGVNMETDINQLGFISHYSPIVHDPAGVCFARPEYYAMLAFAMAGRGEILKSNLDNPDAINLTAYATRDSRGTVWLTLINKDLIKDATIECGVPRGLAAAEPYHLSAPFIDAKTGVTMAGTAVNEDGAWAPRDVQKVGVIDGVLHIPVPHASAAVLKFTAK